MVAEGPKAIGVRRVECGDGVIYGIPRGSQFISFYVACLAEFGPTREISAKVVSV